MIFLISINQNTGVVEGPSSVKLSSYSPLSSILSQEQLLSSTVHENHQTTATITTTHTEAVETMNTRMTSFYSDISTSQAKYSHTITIPGISLGITSKGSGYVASDVKSLESFQFAG